MTTKKDLTAFLKAFEGDKEIEARVASEAGETRGWLHTGNYALNWAVSGRFGRGWPMGHVSEIYGEEGSGKSLVVLRTIGACQATGGVAALDDTENALVEDWAAALGVNTDQLIVANSRTVGAHAKIVEAFVAAMGTVKEGTPGVLALDSLATLTTEHELEVEFDKRSMQRAQDIRKLFRKYGTEVAKLDAAYLVTNHEIANIGNYFKPKTTPGGSGTKYQASVRVAIAQRKTLKDSNKEPVGITAALRVTKNRLTAPYKTIEMVIPWYRPLSEYSGIIPILVRVQVIAVGGKGNQNIVYHGEDTGIKAYASKTSDRVKQDESAAELVETHPGILAEADDYLQRIDEARRTGAFDAEEEGEEE